MDATCTEAHMFLRVQMPGARVGKEQALEAHTTCSHIRAALEQRYCQGPKDKDRYLAQPAPDQSCKLGKVQGKQCK